ncbi:MAG: uracil-DNA glycosylase [Chromatiales bacterium]|nr:uracil-DNA glycosylase [Chromatiales bacterium]
MSTTTPRLTSQQRDALDAMGIDVWTRRTALAAQEAAVPDPAPATTARPAQWEILEREALACTKCALHGTRTRVVFGVGDRGASWMVIGEAPGADEDRQGEPFVGRAGQLLNEMLRAAGVSREQVYIANILKCRPPDNRDPRPEESASCEGYLQRQIELVRPGLLLAVGRIAAQNLLRVDTPIGQLRGQVHRYGPAAIPLVVTYHPAYLLRSPGQKRKSWEDLCLARATVPPLRTPASGPLLQAVPAKDER